MPPVPDDLPDTDKALVAAVRRGKAWAPSPKRPTTKELAEPAFVKNLPTIQATTIRALCLGEWGNVPFHPQGIEIVGVCIDGKLDLSYATVRGPLRLLRCHLATRAHLKQASFPLLDLSGSRLKEGFDGENIRITGDLFCSNSFTSTGEVCLLGAEIGGIVDFSGATLENAGSEALYADGIRITGDLFCRDGFTVTGEVRLLGAQIGGDIDFSCATLDNAGSEALNADRIRITGNLFCGDGFTAIGDVHLQGAQIDGTFDWDPKAWSGTLFLVHTRAGQWRDNWNGSRWPCDGDPKIDLRDFRYGNFAAPTSNTDAESRIAWVRASLGDGFAPGPYETLTKLLRANGDDEGANTVALEKRRHRTRHRVRPDVTTSQTTRLRFRLTGYFLDAVIGYGYRPWRGLIWLLGFLLVGCAVFEIAGPILNGGTGIMKPAIPIVYASPLVRCPPGQFADHKRCTATPIDQTTPMTSHAIDYKLPIEYPPFSPFWYSLDTLIPLVDLGQGTAWSPSPFDGVSKDPWGWLVLAYLYIHIIAGWVLTSLTVVALTGIIKKDE